MVGDVGDDGDAGDDDGGDDGDDDGGAGDDDGDDGDEGDDPAMDAELEYGMEIIDMEEDGPAANAGLQVGDIITAINGMATPDFDSLRVALEACGSQGTFDFINAENGEPEQIDVSVDETRIGASVEQVVIPPPPDEDQ